MEEVPVVQHDNVVLSTAEKAALKELVAALRAEDAWLAARLGDDHRPVPVTPRTQPARDTWATRTTLLLAVAITSLLVGGVLAVVATGDIALSAWLAWGWGTLAALCLVVTRKERRRRRVVSSPLMASLN